MSLQLDHPHPKPLDITTRVRTKLYVSGPFSCAKRRINCTLCPNFILCCDKSAEAVVRLHNNTEQKQ